MKALELYKFVEKTGSEYHWESNDKRIYLFVGIENIAEFNKIIGIRNLDDEGVECIMKDGYFAFEMVEICEYNDVDPKEVFTEKHSC